jgi:hypothetical protein
MLLSTRLNLQLPEATDGMFEGDDVLSHNYDLIDYNAHCVVVDNKEDVLAPFDGMHIHTLSDGLNFIRKSGEWKAFAETPEGGGSGSMGTNGTTARQTVTNTNTEIKIMQITFTPEVAKRYLIKASVTIGSGSGSYNFCELRLRWAAGTNVTTAGTLIAAQQSVMNSSFAYNDGNPVDRSEIFFDEIFPNNTTQLSVGLFAYGWNFGIGDSYINPTAMGTGAGFVTYSNISAYDWGL